MKKLLPIGLLLMLTACSRSPDRSKIVKSLKSIQSWTATARMVGEAWQQASIPQQYARQTLIKSREEIVKEAAELPDPPTIIKQLEETISSLTDKIDRSDNVAFATSLGKFSTQQQQLDKFTKSQERQP
jgi:hypothetical protein